AGNVDQAIKVHRDLTARSSLEPGQRLQILRALVQDYEARQKYEMALTIVQQILNQKKEDLWAREKQLQLYEEMEDWEKAAEAYKKLAKMKGGVKKSRLALYKVETGKKYAKQGDEKQARVCFREAIKMDRQCSAAYLELCDSYLRENRPEDAVNVLEKFMESSPDKAALAFSRVKEVLFSIGEFGEIENIYSQVIYRSPENWQAYLALAEIKEKKGEIEEAIEWCQRILQKNPDYAPARAHLVRYYHRSGHDQLAVEQALALLNTPSNSTTVYQCRHCGHQETEPFWHCSQCQKWETVPGI
ncbi:MAG: tetratricopeptide repeat protein, partial [Calditrichaeota bacterium]